MLPYLTLSLVLFLIAMQAVAFRDRAVAVTVARDAATAAAAASHAAENASFTSNMTLARIEALFSAIEQQGGKTLRATARMEDATAVVAENLAGDKTRASDRLHSEDYQPGTAADVYAATPSEETGAVLCSSCHKILG